MRKALFYALSYLLKCSVSVATTKVAGTIEILSADATAFITDPNVLTVVGERIADLSGVGKDEVSVTLSLKARRLRGKEGRSLQETSVLANYIITIPQGTNAANIIDALSATTPDSLTVAFSEALDEILGQGTFVITVANRSDPAIITDESQTVTTTTTATFTSDTVTTTSGAAIKVGGTMQILSTDADAFVSDRNVLRVVTESIANLSGVLNDGVSVTLDIIEDRRLRENEGRTLQSASVLVSYIITVPQGTNVASIINSINATTPDTLTATISGALDETLGQGAFNISVTSRSTPVIITDELPTATTTTNTATTTTDNETTTATTTTTLQVITLDITKTLIIGSIIFAGLSAICIFIVMVWYYCSKQEVEK